MSNFDHHNGKVVKKVSNPKTGRHPSIVFEDGHKITLGGVESIPKELVGLALLTVEKIGNDENLVFGHTQADGPAIRVQEVLVARGGPQGASESASEATNAEG